MRPIAVRSCRVHRGTWIDIGLIWCGLYRIVPFLFRPECPEKAPIHRMGIDASVGISPCQALFKDVDEMIN